MNQEESDERTEREERYAGSQDDIRVIRRELNKLTAAVGDLVVAIKGNDFGNDGLLKRVAAVEEMTEDLKGKVDDLSVKADKRANQLGMIVLMAGAFLGIFLKWVFDLFGIKK